MRVSSGFIALIAGTTGIITITTTIIIAKC